MKVILYLLSFIIFFNYSAYSEEWVDIYSKSGDKLQVALPDGYCNISNTTYGKLLMSHLQNTLSLNSFLAPKIIYKLCNSVSENYPWGYIALFNEKLPNSLTQRDLSEVTSEGMNDRKITDLTKNEINKINKDLDNGITIKSFGTYNILWDDENALIYYATAKSVVENKDVIEIITGSATLYNRYAVYNHIYEEYGEHKPLINAQLILNAMKLTKSR
jgi:hypothetical protein